MTLDSQLAAAFIRDRWSEVPKVAIILGTGLGGLVASVHRQAEIPYDEIPCFPRATALGHRGRLVCGRLGQVPIIAMQGRCHVYEGYDLSTIAFPVRTLARLGAGLLIVTNASGGLNPRFRQGDVMLIADHINLLGTRPAAAASNGLAVPSRTRVPTVYDPQLIQLAASTARRENFAAQQGVYVGVPGPSYETRAEYRAFRRLGGDAVGMSTIPEVLAAADAGMRILGLSTITNVAQTDVPCKTDPHRVLDAAAATEPKLRKLVEQVVAAQENGS